MTCFRSFGRHTGHIIPRKLRWLRYCRTSYTGVRRRWSSMPGVTGSFRRIWHRWSWSTVAKTSHNVRCERCGARLVQFVLDRSPPICQSQSKPVVYGPHALRCTTRIGSRPDLISYIVHRWHRSIGRASWTTCPPLCWRHSSVWILFTVVNWSITIKHIGLHWRCCWLDGVI